MTWFLRGLMDNSQNGSRIPDLRKVQVLVGLGHVNETIKPRHWSRKYAAHELPNHSVKLWKAGTGKERKVVWAVCEVCLSFSYCKQAFGARTRQ